MKRIILCGTSLICLFLNGFPPVLAQEDNTEEDFSETTSLTGIKGFHVGFYLGANFANNETARIYDGYGFDYAGNKNTFENSYMFRKLYIENGGFNGQQDRIAEQLKVNHEDWYFNEDDMPSNIRYKPSFLLGLHLNYGISKREAILFNLNFSQISVTGNFTLNIVPPSGSNQLYPSIRHFPLLGKEQRMMFQLGYSRIFGNHKFINFMAEAGLTMNYAKVLKNFIYVENLKMDLMSFTNFGGYNYTEPEYYRGVGFGAFAGLGLCFRLNAKYTATLLYSPSYEKYKIGINPGAGLQHAAGLRVYYLL